MLTFKAASVAAAAAATTAALSARNACLIRDVLVIQVGLIATTTGIWWLVVIIKAICWVVAIRRHLEGSLLL